MSEEQKKMEEESMEGSSSNKRRKRRKINSLSEIPKGWSLLSAGMVEEKLEVPENLREDIAIIKIKAKIGEKIIDVIWVLKYKTFEDKNIIFSYKEKAQSLGYSKVYIVQVDSKEVIPAIYEDFVEASGMDDNLSDQEGLIKEVRDIIEEALEKGASDVHIESRLDEARIRMRINGEIINYQEYAASKGPKYGRIIYQVFSKESGISFNPKKVQDALVDQTFGDKRVRARVATIPASPDGFDMILRLLVIQNSSKPRSLSDLGYSKAQENLIKLGFSKPVGGIIIAGTTGSGKSTSLQNLLMSKILERDGKIKVITVEDPPEYFIPGATQVPVIRDANGDAKAAFSSTIRGAMRSDPDLIMIGEIRDEQSAELFVNAVQSGHQVASTIHSSSALSIINRLESFGITRETLGSPEFISALVYQKLLPRLCDACSRKIVDGKIPPKYSAEYLLLSKKMVSIDNITNAKTLVSKERPLLRVLQDQGHLNSQQVDFIKDEIERLNEDSDAREGLLQRLSSVLDISKSNVRFKGEGCSHCNGTGIVGRIVVSEVVVPDFRMLSYIASNNDTELITYWRKNLEGKFAIEDAIEKLASGLVDPYEVENEVRRIGSNIV